MHAEIDEEGRAIYAWNVYVCSFRMTSKPRAGSEQEHHQCVHVSEPTNISACVYKRHTHSSLLYWTLVAFSILQGDSYNNTKSDD